MLRYGEAVFGTVTESVPCVMTTHGMVQGRNKKNVAVFRGIPYGGSCQREYRFKRAKPAADWEGIRDCTHMGLKSWQITDDMELSNVLQVDLILEEYEKEKEQMGEDCLNLNVVTPGLDEKRRAVVVYIHGGGFTAGSGSLAALSDQWAREEDIVIVGVNHRLNVFGYLYLGMFDEKYRDSGNAGMYDLILALEWVRDNIASFGGDPDNVTIMGESGGCMKVNTLLSMEAAKGLFQKAIGESGSMQVNLMTPDVAATNTYHLLKILDIEPADWKKLLYLPPETLIDAFKRADFSELSICPVADGIAFSPFMSSPEEYELPEYGKNIPMIIGFSEDELAIMHISKLSLITEDNMHRQVLAGTKESLAKGLVSESNVDALITCTNTVKGDETPYQKYARNVSLGGSLCRESYREALAKTRAGGAPVYHYLVAYDSPVPWMKGVRVAYHTADLPLQFRVVYFNECEFLSKIIAHSFAGFIRTGNPSTESLNWPQFTAKGRETMIFDTECRVEEDPLREEWDILGQE